MQSFKKIISIEVKCCCDWFLMVNDWIASYMWTLKTGVNPRGFIM